QVLTGLIPYHYKHDIAVLFAKCKGENPAIPPAVSQTLAKLMQDCWDSNRHQRPCLGRIKEVVQREMDSLRKRPL
ncbi:hypothetical protein EDC04DRAFT_2573028, partial [Pisolithus marmoratus]